MKLTKNQALKASEKLLRHIYDGEVEITAKICTAVEGKDVEYLYHCLNEVEKFINEVKEGLKS